LACIEDYDSEVINKVLSKYACRILALILFFFRSHIYTSPSNIISMATWKDYQITIRDRVRTVGLGSMCLGGLGTWRDETNKGDPKLVMKT
jgi:hypothetical protein